MGLLRSLSRVARRWRGDILEDSPSAESGASDWAGLIPQLIGAALLAATLVLLVLRHSSLGAPTVVVFDVIKYANAQRAVASRFIVGKNAEEAAPLLLDVSKRTREVIQEVAGPRVLVVIRQAVVQGEMRDITDAVLQRLGLPTDVPTADPASHVLDVAPTLLGAGPQIRIDAAPNSGAAASSPLP